MNRPAKPGWYTTKRGNTRPTRAAAGMMNTSDRSKHYLTGDALTLAVNGTLDTLKGGYRFLVSPAATTCSCCGQRLNKWTLNERGRLRLARLKRTKSCAR